MQLGSLAGCHNPSCPGIDVTCASGHRWTCYGERPALETTYADLCIAFDARAAQLEVALQTAPLTVLEDGELRTYGGVRVYLSTLAVTYSVRAGPLEQVS